MAAPEEGPPSHERNTPHDSQSLPIIEGVNISGGLDSEESDRSDVAAECGSHADDVVQHTESSEELLKQYANHLFHHIFEAILGPLIGKHGCPFVSVIYWATGLKKPLIETEIIQQAMRLFSSKMLSKGWIMIQTLGIEIQC